jgi:hypothetical protein
MAVSLRWFRGFAKAYIRSHREGKAKLTGSQRATLRRGYVNSLEDSPHRPGKGIGFGASSAMLRNARAKKHGFSSNAARRAAALKAWDTRGRGRKK